MRTQLMSLLPGDDAPDQADSAEQVWLLEGRVLRAQYEELLRLRDEEGMPDALVRPVMQALDVQSAAHKGRARPSGTT